MRGDPCHLAEGIDRRDQRPARREPGEAPDRVGSREFDAARLQRQRPRARAAVAAVGGIVEVVRQQLRVQAAGGEKKRAKQKH